MSDASWLDIHVDRLAGNIAAIRRRLDASVRLSPGGRRVRLCAVLKADAYGLGARALAPHVTPHANMVAVYSRSQAESLLEAGLNGMLAKPVLLLGPVHTVDDHPRLRRAIAAGQAHLALHDRGQAAALVKLARRLDAPINVHLYIDTGMSRSGFRHHDAAGAIAEIRKLPQLNLTGVYTHFAAADVDESFTLEQADAFDHAIAPAALPASVVRHAANTFGAMRGPRFHYQMIRVGLGLYGYGGRRQADIDHNPNAADLSHVVCWRSTINHIERYPNGRTIGYGRTKTLTRDSVLGVIPVGYADGYPTAAANAGGVVVLPTYPSTGQHAAESPQRDAEHVKHKGHARSRFAAAPIVGAVNMDQIVVDLTDFPQAAVGDIVELISDDAASPCSLPKVADFAQTHCYDLLTRINPRIKRNLIRGQASEPRSHDDDHSEARSTYEASEKHDVESDAAQHKAVDAAMSSAQSATPKQETPETSPTPPLRKRDASKDRGEPTFVIGNRDELLAGLTRRLRAVRGTPADDADPPDDPSSAAH